MNVERFVQVKRSLSGMVGSEYTNSACAAHAFFSGTGTSTLLAAAEEEVEFYPESVQERLSGFLGRIGSQVVSYPFAVGHEAAGVVEAVSAIPACSSRRSSTFDAIRGLAILGRSWWVSVRKESWVPEEGFMVGAG